MSSNVDAGIAETKEAWIWIVSILFGTNLQGTHGLWNERTTMSLIYGGRLILRLRRISTQLKVLIHISLFISLLLFEEKPNG